MRSVRFILAASLAVIPLLACSRAPVVDATAAAPESLAGHECAVCGMVVDEQPAPRGQVLHRGGERAFLCSLGDLRAYVQAPNPLGAPSATWVEALGADWTPDSRDASQKGWVPAGDAAYVVGFERPGVMGQPVASFGRAPDARAVAEAEGRRTVTWRQLEAAPFNTLP